MPFKDPEIARQRHTENEAKRRRADPEYAQKIREACKRWYDTRGTAVEYANNRNRKRVLRNYKLTEEAYQRLLAMQGFACAICGVPHIEEKHKRLSIDHCHTSGTIRGLLCTPCNTALGKMKDDPQRLRAAADYLEKAYDA